MHPIAMTLIVASASSSCDVHLDGPKSAIEALTVDLVESGVRVGSSCRHHIRVQYSDTGWKLNRSSSDREIPPEPWRSVETRSEAVFVIMAWIFEDAVEPLLEPTSIPDAPRSPVSPHESPTRPVDIPPLPPSEALVFVVEEDANPRHDLVRPWSLQPALWVGVDDDAVPWIGGGLDLRYRRESLEAILWVRVGTSEGGRMVPQATQTRRNSIDLLIGGGPVIEWRHLSLRPRLAVGAGGVWAHRSASGECPQPGSCDPGTREIGDGFTGVSWVPKALVSAELGWRIAGPLRLALDVGATFAPGTDFVPDYVLGLPESIQQRAGLVGIPSVLGHGSLGLSLELP